MKKDIFILLGLYFLWTGCSSDKIGEESIDAIANQINDIEEIAAEGNIKNENYEDGLPKVETYASENVKQEIVNLLRSSFYKQQVYTRSLNGEGEVGVIKEKNSTCGKYKELEIYMDCEDSKTSNKAEGWHGAFAEVGSGNVAYYFCVIPTKDIQFKRGRNEYAVLHLGGQIPDGINSITCYVDNEHKDNRNTAKYDGVSYSGYYGPCEIGVKHHTIFALLHYLPINVGNPLPNLGIQYGVFGKLGNAQGYFITDDEDDSNANSCIVRSFQNGSYTQQNVTGEVGNILIQDKNTRFWTSKVQ